MARLGSRPYAPGIAPNVDMGDLRLVASRVNGGMITTIDPADIPNEALQLAFNANIRFDKTQRRLGSVLLNPLKPNSLPVTRIAFIKKKTGEQFTLRFTPTTIHIRGESGWTSINLTVPLIGGVNDRFTTADILDTFIFANNGLNNIQAIDFSTGICDDLSVSAVPTNYRFVVLFFNRAVGLALKDANEIQVGWSADGDATIWDPAVDQTAGNSPILESPADVSDWITGGLSFSNVMVVFREKSIWLATKQPIPTDPFYFYSAVPGIGCDCSFSIQLIQGGVAWTDINTQNVYAYSPGAAPEIISDGNRDAIFADLVDPAKVFSAYNKNQAEYNIYITRDDNITRAWTYDFKSKAWSLQEFYGLTTAENVELAIAFTTIDELVGTIDDLPGTIDELSKVESIAIPFSFGRNDGTIAVENLGAETDAPHADFPAGIQFETQIVSKEFTIPENNHELTKLMITYLASRPTTLNLDVSKNSGISWTTIKTFTINKVNRPTILMWRRPIRAQRFTFRLRYNSGDVKILEYTVKVRSSGDANQND